MIPRVLPKDLTSYDLIKAFAVIIMVVDHMGYYFFPEQEWWRAIGRIGFPIWFFMVGYARSRNVSRELIVGAGLLAVSSLLLQSYILPFNALVTIILIRLTIDPVMRFFLGSAEKAGAVIILMSMLVIPSFSITEYGFLGMITAMFGYLVRNPDKIPGDPRRVRFILLAFMLFTIGTFIFYEQLSFSFTLPAYLFMAGATAGVVLILSIFRPVSYTALTALCPVRLQHLIQFLGRRTLEIYVAHLILFKVLAALLAT